MIYFSADHHFYHGNIIKYCSRPFKNTNEMEGKLIKNYNTIVKHNDEVYFLGDFAMLKPVQYQSLCSVLNKMNGRKHLILGNHDEFSMEAYLKAGFSSVHSSLILRAEEIDFLLIHDPFDPIVKESNFYYKLDYILCGHIHDMFRSMPEKDMVNVGVDMWDYKPVSVKEVLEELKNAVGA